MLHVDYASHCKFVSFVATLLSNSIVLITINEISITLIEIIRTNTTHDVSSFDMSILMMSC